MRISNFTECNAPKNFATFAGKVRTAWSNGGMGVVTIATNGAAHSMVAIGTIPNVIAFSTIGYRKAWRSYEAIKT